MLKDLIAQCWLILLMLLATFFMTGFAVKINKYEDNLIISGPNLHPRLVIKEISYKKMKLKIGDKFNYIDDKNRKTKRILNIIERDSEYEVILEKNAKDGVAIKQISYLIEQKNYWQNLIEH